MYFRTSWTDTGSEPLGRAVTICGNPAVSRKFSSISEAGFSHNNRCNICPRCHQDSLLDAADFLNHNLEYYVFYLYNQNIVYNVRKVSIVYFQSQNI
jgi:hypothetical protein